MTGNGDIDTHRATYEGLIGPMKWGAAASFLIAFFVLWLIAG